MNDPISPGVAQAPDDPVVVHIIDDDGGLRDSLAFLLGSLDIEALTYPSGTSFLAEFDPEETAVVVVDVRMPGPSGFQVQEELAKRDCPAPVIFCSAHGDVSMSVRAMRFGAVDFLEKPYDPQHMLEVVQEQIASARILFARRAEERAVRARLQSLTARERQVLELVIGGLSSQTIAQTLGTSVKTIDVHRASIRSKTGSTSLGTLVRDVLQHQVDVQAVPPQRSTRPSSPPRVVDPPQGGQQ